MSAAQTPWHWRSSCPASRRVERSPEELRREPIDAIILQRPHEYALVRRWLRRTPGVDVPALYLEHNTPKEQIASTRHPARDFANIPVVHVTHFNQLFWECGDCATYVIEHGVVDPGYRYTGEMPRCAVVINEARRRGRVTGTDLIARFGSVAAALERAADAQEASAAFMLAQTYDPVVLGTQDARRIVPDPAAARTWYERAAQLGSIEAQRRLGQLPN